MDLKAWFGVAIMVAALLYIPLSAWAATDSWERAWEALRQYLKIIGLFAAVGGGVGMLMIMATLIDRT